MNPTQTNYLTTLPSVSLAMLAAAAAVPSAEAQNSATNQTTKLPTVVVTGANPATSYHQPDSGAATRLDVPAFEVPTAQKVIGRQLLNDVTATRLDDALDYVSGISRQNSFGGLWDNFAIRGLAGNENTGMTMLRNGFGGNRGFNAPRDVANVERIEFLKGTAAALYGNSEPGGTLNLVTKRPKFTEEHQARVLGGSFGRVRGEIDTTGPLGESVAYRLNAAGEDSSGFRDFVTSRRYFVAPAMTWKVSDQTTVEYDGEWLRHEAPLDRGVIAINGQLGLVPRERFLGEPGDGVVTLQNQTHQVVVQHQVNENWRARAGLSFRYNTLEGFSTEATALQADNRTLTRQRRYRDYYSHDTAFQTDVTGKFETGPLKHDLLAGVEGYYFMLDQFMLRRNPTALAPYAIDVFNPVYGQAPLNPAANTDTREDTTDIGLYLHDQVAVGEHWRVLAGLRFDQFDQRIRNLRTAVTTQQQPGQVVPRVGVTWLPTQQWAAYTSYGTSFRPNFGTDFAGRPFDPEQGDAWEAGIKFESKDKRMGATLSVFHITKENVLTSDPANAGFSVQTGEVRSRGVEFDFLGQVTDQVRVVASAAWTDAEVTRDNTLAAGTRLLNVPEWNANALAIWEDSVGSGRLGLGSGVTYVGGRSGVANDAFSLPAYTTLKLLAYYRFTPNVMATLDVENVLDRTYYESSFSQMWVRPGDARAITVGLQVRF